MPVSIFRKSSFLTCAYYLETLQIRYSSVIERSGGVRDLNVTAMASGDGAKYASGEALTNLQFPIYERDWSAQEELALLDGVQQYGLGNWK